MIFIIAYFVITTLFLAYVVKFMTPEKMRNKAKQLVMDAAALERSQRALKNASPLWFRVSLVIVCAVWPYIFLKWILARIKE